MLYFNDKYDYNYHYQELIHNMRDYARVTRARLGLHPTGLSDSISAWPIHIQHIHSDVIMRKVTVSHIISYNLQEEKEDGRKEKAAK